MNKNVDIIELSKVNPKKTINKFLIPNIASTLIIYLNIIVDSFWVSGLSSDALTAIGLVSPIYVIIIGLGGGFGSGINSVMSRFKSAGKNEDANNTIIHTIVLAMISYFIMFFIGKFFVDDLIVLVGGESVLPLCRAYIQPALILSIFLMTPDINAGLYRAIGDIKRSSNSFIVIAIFNIILDPIFIYVLNFGISGAIYATILSSILGLIYMNIGQDFRKDIILPVKHPHYKLQPKLFKELLIVSIPVTLNDVAHSIFSISVNYLIIFTAGVGEIASFVIVKQLIRFVYAPSSAIGSIIITVTGATYASKIWDKLEEGINYATIVGLGITVIIALIFFIFPHQFCGIYGLTLSDTNVIDRAAEILMIMVFFNLLAPLQVMAVRSFQGMGKGLISLVLSIFSEAILPLLVAYLLGIILTIGIFGVYSGIVIGYSLAAILCFILIKFYIRRCRNKSETVVSS